MSDAPRQFNPGESSMREHYVTFYSPGTFVTEETTRPIDSWDTATAVTLSRGVVERYGARPHSFRFTTRLTAAPVPDGEGGKLTVEPKEVARSGLYFLGGRLRTLDEVRAVGRSDEKILASNMECNGWPVVVENTNSWKATLPFGEEDVIVDDAGNVVERGDDPKWVKYRAAKAEERRRELDQFLATKR